MDEGSECQFEGCTEVDFLPQQCPGCKKCFCQYHAAPSAHHCAAGGLSMPNRVLDEEATKAALETKYARLEGSAGVNSDKLKTCTQCGIVSAFTVTECSVCGLMFCLDHRHHADHVKVVPMLTKQAVSTAPKTPAATATKNVVSSSNDGSAPTKRLLLSGSSSGSTTDVVLLLVGATATSGGGVKPAGGCDANQIQVLFATVSSSWSLGKAGEALQTMPFNLSFSSANLQFSRIKAHDLGSLIRSRETAPPLATETTLPPSTLFLKTFEGLDMFVVKGNGDNGDSPCLQDNAALKKVLMKITYLKAKYALMKAPTVSTATVQSEVANAAETKTDTPPVVSAEAAENPAPKASGEEAPPSAESTLLHPCAYDDSRGDSLFLSKTKSIFDLKFSNTKLKPRGVDACKGVMGKVTVAVFMLEKKTPTSPLPAPYCLMVASEWPLGRVLDHILKESDLPMTNHRTDGEEDKWHLFNLKTIECLTAAGQNGSQKLKNGDVLGVHRGPRLPLSVVTDILNSQALVSNTPSAPEAKAVKLRMMKECIAM